MKTKLIAPNSWKSTDSHMIQHFFSEEMSKCNEKKTIECVSLSTKSILLIYSPIWLSVRNVIKRWKYFIGYVKSKLLTTLEIRMKNCVWICNVICMICIQMCVSECGIQRLCIEIEINYSWRPVFAGVTRIKPLANRDTNVILNWHFFLIRVILIFLLHLANVDGFSVSELMQITMQRRKKISRFDSFIKYIASNSKWNCLCVLGKFHTYLGQWIYDCDGAALRSRMLWW